MWGSFHTRRGLVNPRGSVVGQERPHGHQLRHSHGKPFPLPLCYATWHLTNFFSQAENIPREFNVSLLANVHNPHSLYGAKGIGSLSSRSPWPSLQILRPHMRTRWTAPLCECGGGSGTAGRYPCCSTASPIVSGWHRVGSAADAWEDSPRLWRLAARSCFELGPGCHSWRRIQGARKEEGSRVKNAAMIELKEEHMCSLF